MLAWVVEEHRRRQGAVWLGRCSPELSPPFAPLVAALGGQWPTVSEAAADQAMHLPSSLDQPEPALHLVRAVADVVARAAATRPLLLGMDDLQWADPGTLGLLEQLVYLLEARAAEGCRVLVLLTSRPLADDSAAAGVLARTAREPAFRSLALDPLDEVEVHELIRRLTGTPPDRRVARRVHEASAGNPLVAIAAVDVARPGTGRRPLGRTVDTVLGRLVDGLTPTAARVALALAVNDRPTPRREMAARSGLSDDDSADGLDELDRAQLVVVDDDGCELLSPLVAEAVLARASTRERQAAHARVATLLRADGGTEVDLLAVAHHLERAGPRGAGELREVAPAAADRAFAAGVWGWAARL